MPKRKLYEGIPSLNDLKVKGSMLCFVKEGAVHPRRPPTDEYRMYYMTDSNVVLYHVIPKARDFDYNGR